MIARLLAWAIAAAVVFGVVRFVAAWESPFSQAMKPPVTLDLSIPGCPEGGCKGQ